MRTAPIGLLPRLQPRHPVIGLQQYGRPTVSFGYEAGHARQDRIAASTSVGL
jgi:hypothetical protein